MEAAWSLSQAERDAMVSRIANNIATIAFFRGAEISDEAAAAAAAAAERRAFTAAQVAARTTTGSRPAAETTSAYARKLGELVLEAVKEAEQRSGADDAATASAAHSLDLSGGARDFLDADTARAALAPLLAAGAAVRHVRFSTKSFGVDAARVAAEALRAVAHSLERADMSDIIAGRPEDEALEALRVVAAALATARLRHLNLSDNALGEKGLRAAADALRHEGLEFLSLQNVGCSVHACKALQELLPPGRARLAGLHLYNNMSGDEGAAHVAALLARCPQMEDFKMASSRVGPSGGIALAGALRQAGGAALVRLDLSDNPLTAEAAPALAALLAAQPHLRHLNLNDTGLTDEGVGAVCAALAAPGAAPQLEALELALNEVTPAGARSVVLAIAGKRHLAKLNLRENELEDAGAAVLARGVAALPSLRVLDLTGNQLTRPGALAVARAVAAAAKAAGGAAAGGGFELLALDENAISDAGVEQLRGILREAFGSDAALGPLDENDPDGDDDDEDEDEGDAAAAEEDDELTAALARTHI